MRPWLVSSGAALLLFVLASTVNGYKTGLMGYGQSWYDPACAYACRAVIGSAPLDCPDDTSMHMGGMHMSGGSPMAPCIAENVPFLSTLAHCMNTNCPAYGVSASKLEAYWADQATGDARMPPKWTYGAVLANITQTPNRTFATGDTLNYTALISNADFSYQYDFDVFFDWEEAVQSTYVIVIISVGVATPVLLSLITHLPFMTSAIDRIKPHLVYPSTISGYNIRPLPYLLGNAPTMGQGLWIAMFVILNIILGSIEYKNFNATHPWGFTKRAEILAYVGYRTGHISFALLPLTVLFSSRNNVLLWITDWPFSTFLVLHRWVARVCAVHAIVHSITLLAAYVDLGTYYTDVHKPYWIWGIVATLCLVILLFQSVMWFRRASYEIFLILHIFLAVFTVAGCWYHVYYWKPFSGVYELWLYMVSAVWFFDRLMRVLRVVKNGVPRATVVELSPETVRLDIRGLRWSPSPGYHAYVYFPTLQPLRPWENHPFSICNAAMLRPADHSISPAHDPSHSRDVEMNKGPEMVVSRRSATTGPDGICIYVKKHQGLTSLLRECGNLPVLLDGPYRGSLSREVLRCDRVLLIGGGIGITGVLTWVRSHVNVKLAWSLRETSTPVLRDLETFLGGVDDKVISVGQRLDVDALLQCEVDSGWGKVGVVVCGPAGLCDATREAVVRFGKQHKTIFELEPPKQDGEALERRLSTDSTREYPQGLRLWAIIASLCLTVFLVALDQTIIAPALGAITTEFGSVRDIGWYGAAYLLTATALQPIYGSIYRLFDIKLNYLGAIVMFEIGSLICALAPSSTVFIIGRAIAGMGSAGLFSGGVVIVAHTLPLSQRPLGLGLIGGMWGTASVAGPLMGGAFTNSITWRWYFYVNLPIGGVSMAFIFLLLKINRKENPRDLSFFGRVVELDLVGASMLVSAVICLLLALQWGNTQFPWNSSQIIGLFVGSVLMAIIFIGIQIRKGDAGILPPRFFKSKDVVCAMVFSALFGAAFFPLIYYLSLFFQAVKGDTAVQAGIKLLPLLLSCVVTSIIGGGLITAFSYYNPIVLPSMAMFTVGCGLITTLSLDSPTREWLGFQVLAGLGLGAGLQVPILVVQATLPLEDVPVATACVQLFQSLGGSIFIAVAQAVFQNGLIRGIERDAPQLDGQLFTDGGASQIRSILAQLGQEQALDAVLNAYLTGLRHSYFISVGCAAGTFVAAACLSWTSVKGKAAEPAEEASEPTEVAVATTSKQTESSG